MDIFAALWSHTLDPNKTIEEVEFPSSVGTRTPVGPSDFIGLLGKAGVLSNFVQDVGWQGTIFVSLENHTYEAEEEVLGQQCPGGQHEICHHSVASKSISEQC